MEIKKREKILSAILILLFIGLIFIQYLWVENAFQFQKEEFIDNIQKELEIVKKQYEESFYCIDLTSSDNFKANDDLYVIHQTETITDTLEFELHYSGPQDSAYYYKEIPLFMDARVDHLIHVEFHLSDEYENSELYGVEQYLIVVDTITNKLKDFPVKINLLDTLLNERFVESLGLNDIEFYISTHDPDVEQAYISNESLNEENYIPIQIAIFNDNYFLDTFSLTVLVLNDDFKMLKNNAFLIISTIILLLLIIPLIYIFYRQFINQQRLSELKSDFIQNMAHEMKTPISNINLAVDTLFSKEHNFENQLRYSGIIKEELERLKDNTNRFLEISLFENGGVRLDFVTHDVHEIIRNLSELFQLNELEKVINIKFDLNAEESEFLLDKSHFSNALFNLIDNAIKYSEYETDIVISTFNKDNRLIVLIEDKGIGIDKMHIGNIFDKFYRVPKGSQHDVKGFGLGLFYVKQIINAHGGIIQVNSILGKGTKFELIL